MHSISDMSYKRQLQKAEQKLLVLDQQKKAIEQQMRGWIKIIEGLRALASNPKPRKTQGEAVADKKAPGLTDSVRWILIDANTAMGATQIRDALRARGNAESTNRNVLVNIHTTLKRLKKSGEVEEVPRAACEGGHMLPDGTKLYRYVTPLARALNNPFDLLKTNMLYTNLYGEPRLVSAPGPVAPFLKRGK